MNNFPYRRGANSFVVYNNKFLLVQKLNYGDDQWDTPGGGIKDGENHQVGILRELKEELGTDKFKLVGKSDVINRFEWPESARQHSFEKSGKWYRGQEKYQFLVKYLGKKDDIKPQKEEIKQIKWVSEDQLKEHLVFEGQYENAIEVLSDFRNKGFL